MGTALKDAFNLRQRFNSFIKSYSGINSAGNLKINAWMTPRTGGTSRNLSNGNALLVGDAAGLVDPFLGEGIPYAIQSSKIAAECIINNKVEDYSRRVGEEITGKLRYARFLAAMVKHSPRRSIKLLFDDETTARDYLEIPLGNSTYKQFLKNTARKVLTTPLKLIKRWMEGLV